ncbi:type IV pilus modification PilV family protein [Aquabacterium sp.]|uniref:type IV pilus modification PilV family protein n=1 Tax=Aquabacterium sp. TaxID=1872578 RepID=UPI003D6D9DAF
MRPNFHRPPVRSAKGFMLIEVLVSVLLFSVGVLALVGLQANMTKAQSSAKARTDAAYLARELVGTMWSDHIDNLSFYQTTACASYARCSAWQAKVAQELPSANVTINVATGAANFGDVTIRIEWTEADGATHNYTTITTINAS